MIAVDSNILVYAHQVASPHHAKATGALKELDQGSGQWAVPWPCVHEFYGVITHLRIRHHLTPIHNAIGAVSALVKTEGVMLIGETDSHWDILQGLLVSGGIVGPRIHDARIAAICLEHGVRELWSADRDFGRFPELKVVNPLVRP